MTTPAPASDAASAHYASYGTQEAQYGDFTTYGDHDATGFDTDRRPRHRAASRPTRSSATCRRRQHGHDTVAATASHDRRRLLGWSTGGHQTLNYDPYAAQHHAAYDTGAYDTSAWVGRLPAARPRSPRRPRATDTSGQWDAGAWLQPDQSRAARRRPDPALGMGHAGLRHRRVRRHAVELRRRRRRSDGRHEQYEHT